MPLYDFHCMKCGRVETDVLRRMNDLTRPEACPYCAYQMIRQFPLIHTTMQEYHTPIEMFSIAMEDQNEIRAFKQKCPDVEISDDPRHRDFGIPIARSRHAKNQALKAAGYVEKS